MRFLVGFLLIAASLITGCASKQPDATHAHLARFPGRPESPPNNMYARESATNNDLLAASTVLSSIISAVTPGQNTPRLVTGECRVRQRDDSNIFIPCENVRIVLKDTADREIAQAVTEGGEFALPVQRGKKYKLTVRSKNYRLTTNLIGPVSEGDRISVDIVPQNEP